MATEAAERTSYKALDVGDPAPWFHQRSTSNPNYAFDSVAGRYVVLCFFGSASDQKAQSALTTLAAHRYLFDDDRACFFGISADPADEQHGRVQQSMPGIRFFWDFDGRIGKLYGSVPKEVGQKGRVEIRQFWMVLDPALRIMAVFPFGSSPNAVFDYVAKLPSPDLLLGFEVQAPISVIPNVFERSLCDHLISLYEAAGGKESGFMREVDGKTVLRHDPSHKRRKDFDIDDQDLIKSLQDRIIRRVNPEMMKVHCFRATRMERYIVSCYAAEDEGHFRAHRDNTTKGTAHRRFAVSINLNSEFEGGELSFPEYSHRTFKAPVGGAIVFPGAILHEVSKVTEGRRYAFLPFVYDEEAARIREENAKFLQGSASNYKARPQA